MKKDKVIAVLSVLLFLSVSMNLFVGAKVAGHFAHGPFMMRSLSAEDKAIFDKLVDKNRAKMEALRENLENAKRNVIDVAKKEPFDAKALDAALAAEKALAAKMFALMNETRTEAMKQMSPEGRSSLAKMKRGMFKGGCPRK